MKLAWSSVAAVAFVFGLASGVSAQGHTLPAPPAPTGKTSLYPPMDGGVIENLTYWTRPVKCDQGHGITYTFEWGDDTRPSRGRYWATSGIVTGSKVWFEPGTFEVKVRAECAGGLSAYSPVLRVTVLDPPHVVSTPTTPSGNVTPDLHDPIVEPYVTKGPMTCARGHDLVHRFYWGDGRSSLAWTGYGDGQGRIVVTGWKNWKDQSIWDIRTSFKVMVRAECAGGITSAWSPALSVTVKGVTAPSVPRGPTNVKVGDTGTYSVAPSVCSKGHAVEYWFIWGDGSSSPYDKAVSQKHKWTWVNRWGYGWSVYVYARCTQGVVSPRSESLWVVVK